jgi:hypothetical protein
MRLLYCGAPGAKRVAGASKALRARFGCASVADSHASFIDV